MSEQIEEVKIVGWSHKGLKIPDYEIKLDDPNSNRNFSLILQLSGEGKTTTLHLLRYCFYNFLNDINNKKDREEEFEKLKSENPNVDKGEFKLNLKLNKTINYTIYLEFDFKNYQLNYFTSKGDGAGKDTGLLLPDSLRDHLSPEFIKKSFFDLELVNELFDEQEKETDKTIINICKLYFLDKVIKSFDSYKKREEEKVENKNISETKLNELRNNLDKVESQIIKVESKETEYKEKRKNLKSEFNKLESEEKKIRADNEEIDRKLSNAEKLVSESEQEITDFFLEAYKILKNPMRFDESLYDELKEFEDNLTKKRIPKSVGDAFFSDLIASEKCLCGHNMTEEMRNEINISKSRYLTDETYNVLNPIKTTITRTEKFSNIKVNETFDELIKKETNLRKSKNKLTDVKEKIDQARLVEINQRKSTISNELKPINIFLEETLNKKYDKYEDTPDTESLKSLNEQREILKEEISEGTNTVDLNNKTKLIKKYLREVKEESLKEISDKLVEDINKEVPRVLPIEPVYVKSIKNKIELEGKSGAAQGQKARITYLFLVTLLNRPSLKFPFIVDSPVTAMDDISRQEVAKTLVDQLKSQYIGFLLPPERSDFANILEDRLNNNINLIVAFSKNEKTSYLIEKAKNYNGVDVDKFTNGIVSYNPKFFEEFKGTSTQNDENGIR